MVTDLGPPLRASPDRASFPNVRYWARPSGEPWSNNGELGFLEDMFGRYIGDDELSKPKDHSKLIFHDFIRLDMAALRFKGLGKHGIALFVNDIEQQFPYIGLCENHWKALLLGSTVYPQWIRRGGKEVKELLNAAQQEQQRKQGQQSVQTPRSTTAAKAKTKSRAVERTDSEHELSGDDSGSEPAPSAARPNSSSTGELCGWTAAVLADAHPVLHLANRSRTATPIISSLAQAAAPKKPPPRAAAKDTLV